LPGLLLLGGGFLQSLHDVLADEHPGGVVMGADGGGVHADQGQVRPAAAGGLSDQALQQGGEDTGIPPAPEAPIDGRPRPELVRHLTPLCAGPEPPDHPLELIPQPLGVRAVLTYRQERLDQFPLFVGELPARHDHLPTASAIRAGLDQRDDHNITQALGRWSGRSEPVSTALLGNWADPLYNKGQLPPER
jgi:hypothetical protein